MKNSTLIIGEAGVNHNGSFDLAIKLIDAAVAAKVDVVKFQTFKAENLVTKLAPKAEYQKQTESSSNQFDMLKKLELPYEAYPELSKYCKTKEIEFLTTAFDLESLDFLRTLNLKRLKIPSGEITNFPYLRNAAKVGLPTILSTGMANLQEIRDAVSTLMRFGLTREQITVLHCNTEYPTPFGDVHLNAMGAIQKDLGVQVGYSDHTPGVFISVAAVALGAKVIEKHFTLDKTMDGPDHLASLDPSELREMTSGIRIVEQALGNAVKQPSPSEIKNKTPARKSIIAARDIQAGEVFSEENLTVKRPGNGISPMQWETIIGKVATKSYKAEDLI